MTIYANTTPVSFAPPSGNALVNALIGGAKWGGAAGTGVSLTFSFPDLGSSFRSAYYNREPFTGFSKFNAEEQVAVRSILLELGRAINIIFIEVADSGNTAGEMRFGNSNGVSVTAQAHAYGPGSSAEAGDVWVRNNILYQTGVTAGSYNYAALVHEIGHALGLKHPFNGSPNLPADWDNRDVTVMSYTNKSYLNAMTFLPLDLLALHHLYGANYTTATGNDRYLASGFGGGIRTIWDAGGNDTFDFSTETASLSLSLEPGTVRTGPVPYAIAYNTFIENGFAGSGNDAVTGNAVANWLVGNGGNDTIEGLGGNDSLDGGLGDDVLLGGPGDDWLRGDRGNDVLDGSYGRDVANYGLNARDITWQRNGDGSVTVGTGGEGVDRLYRIEALQLLDRAVSLTQPLIRDFDGDSRGDLLTRRASDGAITSYTFGTGMAGAAVTLPAAGATLLGTADVNGDGLAELIWRMPNAGGLQFRTLPGGAAPTVFDPGSNWSIRAVGDFDGDTRTDLLWGNAAGQTYIWLMDGISGASRYRELASPGAGWSVQGSGDLNGDGRSDIMWRHTNGVVWSWLMDGTTIIGNGGQPSPGANWSIKGIGDLDGDARADIVWRSDAGLVWSWFMDGPIAVRNASIGNPGANWDIVAVADASGDGVADIISRNTSGMSWYWVMQGSGIADSGFVAQQSTDWNFIG